MNETCYICGNTVSAEFTNKYGEVHNAYGEVEWSCDNCGASSND